MEIALDGVILATAWLHVSLAPYTKVEESFNLHATQDLLMYGVKDLERYDHFVFPGAVPRTFLGSILLAWLSSPVIQIASNLAVFQDKFDAQIIVRAVLATLNAIGLSLVRRAVTRRFGRSMGLYFTLLSCTQFHLPFWMGRTIPNMFALFFVNLSTYVLLSRAPNSRKPAPRRTAASIAILTFAAAVFRGEIALYLAPLCLQALFTRSISFGQLLKTGVVSGILSAILTITVDSYFWNQKFLWPEFAGLFFNVVEGKSVEWGTSPPLTYFTSFLPKLLLSSLPLSLLGFSFNRAIRGLLLPSFLFIVLISFLGHKEWRFIIYVVPVFNIAAARGLHALFSPRKQSSFGRIRFVLGASFIAINIAFTVFSTAVSVANYPGGEAMRQFHALYNPLTHMSPVHVHISNLAAQSGASLFTQLYSQPTWPINSNVNWIYNKTESLALSDLTAPSSPFTHLILEERPTAKLLDKRGWKVVSAVEAFEGIKLSLNPASIKTAGRQLVNDPSSQSMLSAVRGIIDIRRGEKLWIVERL